MSFGFSVGDFLAVLELANKVRQKWNDAPEEYGTMKDETKNVSVLLENVRKLSQQGTLSDEHVVQVEDSSANCLKVLQRCNSLADKFPATAVGHSSLKSKWKRLHLDPDDVRAVRDQLTSCVSSLNALLTAIQSFQVNKISKRVDSMRDHEAEVLFNTTADWYSSDDFARHQDYSLSLRHPGTGLWALKDPKYKQWEDGDANTLLCPGIPGSGKSVLHATLVDDLRTRYEHDNGVVVVYFYCSFQRQAEQTTRNILSALVRQMFQERHRLPPEVKALYDKHYLRKTSPSVDEVEQLLHSLLTGYRKVFILIDAMDECMRNDCDCIEFLDKLLNLRQSKSAIKLLVTTRWLPHIIQHFGACLQLEIKAQQEDIERYLDHNIRRLPVKPYIKIKVADSMVTVQDAVKSRIVDAADGMFLLARLQFDSLNDKTNPRKLQQALLQLRGGSTALESEYDKALLRIDQQREGFREIAYKVLRWIVYARRELSIAELREAVAIYEGMEDIDHETDLEEELLLPSVCAGLVRIDHEADVVRLVHYTTQEYLKNALPKRNETEISIAKDCLTYLTMDVFKQFALEQEKTAYDRLRKYKLFRYATSHWGMHIKPEFEQDLISQIDGLLFSPGLFQASIRFMFTSMALNSDYFNVDMCQRRRYDLSPSHICAYFDMSLTISRIIDQKGDVDGKDSTGKTPLSWAAEFGRTEIVRLLLERSDASVNSGDNMESTPLCMAVLNGHLDIVKILLQRPDISVNSIPRYVTVLLFKAHKTAKALRRSGDITLRTAVKIGNTEIVQILIEGLELSVDQPTSPFETTAIHRMDRSEHGEFLARQFERHQIIKHNIRTEIEILKVLMEHTYIRNDPSAFNEAELLHYAAVHGTAETMEYLLSSTDASPNMEDSHGHTLLHKAVRYYSRLEIVKVLLKHPDVNPDSSDYNGRTPLSYAAESGSIETVEALLQRPEVNPDSIDHEGRTPLSYAAGCGPPLILEAPLQRSAEVNPDSSNRGRRTPLSYAADSNREETVKLLLKQPTVQPDSKDHQGRTPLSYAAEAGSSNIVKAFLALPQVEMNARDDIGLTPFLWSLKDDEIEVLGVFLRQWLTCSDSAEAFSTHALSAIQDLCRIHQVIGSIPPLLNVFVDLLGRCLLFLGHRDWALFAFQQLVVTTVPDVLSGHHDAGCDGCDMNPISGKRFICMTCAEVDLCARCMKEYTDGKMIKDCVNHEFLEVPGQRNPGAALSGPDLVIESVQDIKLAFPDQSRLDSNSISVASAEWRVGIEGRIRRWGF